MLKIYTYIKVVPNTDKIEIDYQSGTLRRESTQNIINPSDEIALAQALKLKSLLGAHLSVLSMAPPHSAHALSYLLSLGFDKAYLLHDPLFAGSDTLATSSILSAATIFLGLPDLLFFGHHSSDGETGQVPSQTAEFLNLPCFPYTNKIQISSSLLTLSQNFPNEKRVSLTAPLPAAVSWFDPNFLWRTYPQASRFFHAHSVEGISNKQLGLSPATLGLSGSPTRVLSIHTPNFPLRKPEILSFSSLAVKKGALLVIKHKNPF